MAEDDIAGDENVDDLDEMERYRRAAEDALQQLDWAIGYLHGIRKVGISRALARNRTYIREGLLQRSAQPDPSAQGVPAEE
jgi:hypothetical protein